MSLGGLGHIQAEGITDPLIINSFNLAFRRQSLRINSEEMENNK